MASEAEDATRRAINAHNTIEVAPNRYAVKMPGGRYRVFDATNLRVLPAHDTNAGSGVPWERGPLMPVWWAPEWRYALQNKDREIVAVSCSRDVLLSGMIAGDLTITANLDTGKEVLA